MLKRFTPLVLTIAILHVLGAIPLMAASAADLLYVSAPRDSRGDRGAIPLWDSRVSADDCAKAATEEFDKLVSGITTAKRSRDVDKALAESKDRKVAACELGKIGEMTHGTRLKPIVTSEECGNLHKVEVATGALSGKIGCVRPTQVSQSLAE